MADVIATVDGTPIERREFLRQMGRERAWVYQYFHERHGASAGPMFWWSFYGGENPDSVLKQRALDALVRRKAEQLMMVENGVVHDITYASFLQRWASKKIGIAKGAATTTPVYGARNLGEDQAFDYEFASDERELREAVARRTNPTKNDLLATYERFKDQAYRRSISARVRVVRVFYPAVSKERAHALATQLRTRLLGGEEPATFVQSGATTDELLLTKDLGSGTRSRQATYDLLTETAIRLATGDVSDVIDTGDSFAFMRCMALSPKYAALDEVRDDVTSNWQALHFEHLIGERAKRANVQLVASNYAAVNPDD